MTRKLAPCIRRRVAGVAAGTVVLCAVAGATARQARDQPAQRAKVGTGVIAGLVVRGETGQPLADAVVTLVSGESAFVRVAQSDRQGRFLLPLLPAGRYLLAAARPPYLGAAYGAAKPGRAGTTVVLADGQQLLDLELKLWPGAVVSGTVTNERGEPVADVDVALDRVDAPGGALSLAALSLTLAAGGASRVTTDDRGMYRAYGLAPGDYVVSVSPPATMSVGARRLTPEDLAAAERALREPRPPATAGGSVAATGRGTPVSTVLPPPSANQVGPPTQAGDAGSTLAYAPVFFPGTTDPTAATPIALGMGEERGGVNLRLELTPLVRIQGMVVGPDGAPVPNVLVSVQRPGAPLLFSIMRMAMSSTSQTGPDGRFQIRRMAPGQYTLSARTGGGPMGALAGLIGAAQPSAPAPSVLWATAEVSVTGQEVTGLVLQLQPGLTLSGRVVVNATRLPPPDLTGSRVTAISTAAAADPISALAGLGAASFGAQPVRPDGTFEVTGLVPGPYLINGALAGSTQPADVFAWRVGSVVAGGREILDLPFDVKPGALPTDLVITFTDVEQELTGVLSDASGRPLTASTVVLFGTDKRFWYRDSRRVLTARPATDGRYQFGGLLGPSPGEYYLAVVSDLEPGQQFDPTFLSALVPAAIRIVLGPGDRKTQDLQAR